ncbi:MAG: NADH-quinone oxidoreductase subunit N [Candidatus Omnitrophica bacterium]|nr:NADH-quinone oxidoreductase subunit N [Candidatus Omnitrophota bacterium]
MRYLPPDLNLGLLWPEIWLALLILTVFMAEVFLKKEHRISIGQITSWGVAFLVIPWWLSADKIGTACSGLLAVDRAAWYFKGIFLGTAFMVSLMNREFLRKIEKGYGEFSLLLLTALLGMFFMAGAKDLLMFFVSLEVLTFSLYVMTAYLRTDKESVEAGLKYLILGALASSLFLYGTSLVYGTVGSTSFAKIHAFVATGGEVSKLFLLGILLILSALGFKVAAVPFHVWVPDVYQGAPTPVTALLSVGSKAAAFAVFLRLFHSALLPIQSEWALAVAVIAALTVTYGNLSAIPQGNIKRLFGYSSIAQAGYLMMGVAAASAPGATGVAYYLLAYMFMNLGAFLVLVVFANFSKSYDLEDYQGLAQRSPILAATLFVCLISLAGVPPSAGFFGKFLIFIALIKSGMIWLAFIGSVNVVISLYYYLSIVRRMYWGTAKDASPIRLEMPLQIALYACIAGVVAMGVFQAPFVSAAQSAVSGWF